MKTCWTLLVGLMMLAGCAEQGANKKTNSDPRIKVWMGHIRTDIPVLLWTTVDEKDSMLYGQLFYTNYPQPPQIVLIGSAKGGIEFTEYDTAGNITGYWEGRIKGDTLDGIWSSPKTGKRFVFVAGIKDTVLDADPVFTANSNIDGLYRCAYPNEAGGAVSIKKLDATHVIYNASCNTAAPAYNLAIVDDDTLSLAGNEAVRNDSSDEGRCGYTIHFYKNFLMIQHLEDGYNCGFGHAATLNGVYIKTNRKAQMGMTEQ